MLCILQMEFQIFYNTLSTESGAIHLDCLWHLYIYVWKACDLISAYFNRNKYLRMKPILYGWLSLSFKIFFSNMITYTAFRYYYKYIVNGQWRHSTISPTERDDKGNVNNVIIVGDTASVRPSIQQPMKVGFCFFEEWYKIDR